LKKSKFKNKKMINKPKWMKENFNKPLLNLKRRIIRYNKTGIITMGSIPKYKIKKLTERIDEKKISRLS
jgi:hypothetical protein